MFASKKILKREVDLHPTQHAFYHSKALYRGFVGGRGSGKTFVGALDLLTRAGSVRGFYAVYAPTYVMLRDASWRMLLEVDKKVPLNVIRQVLASEMRIVLRNGSEIVGRSLENPERARGLNLSGAWLDEASLMRKEVHPIVIASLRQDQRLGWLSATFTPKGRQHWTYEVFATGKPETALFQCRTYDNPFLPRGFAELLREQYPAHYQRQELEGEFIDPPGAVFKREWFRIVDKAPDGLRWVRYWDLAVSTKESADYTASVAMAMGPDGTIYLRDMIRGRWEWPDQEKIMLQTMIAEYDTVHGIEKALHGIAAIQSLLRRPELGGVIIKGVDVEADKLTRALAFAARAEQGKVALVRGDWIPAFLDELCAFTGTGSTHDDQVDTAAGGLKLLMRPGPTQVQYIHDFWER